MTLALIDGDFLLHSAIWQTKNVEDFISNLHWSIDEWCDSAFADERVIALGPRDGLNYRNDVFNLYKKSVSRSKGRKEKEKTAHLAASKDYLYNLPDVCVGDNIEADDLLGIWGTQIEDSVIVTADKDLDQIPGLHYTPHYMKMKLYSVSEEEAKKFFCLQMLTGDSVDNIIGIKGVGPVKAKTLLEEYNYDVPEIYKRFYEDQWKDWFLSNGKLLYIQRGCDQHFTLDLFEREFRVSTV